MKCSLVSREVIADSIETVGRGQCLDGILAVGGCDKNMPGALIAMARLNIPAIFVYAGTIKPGHYKGEDLTVVSAFEAVGAYNAGNLSEEDLVQVERNACPGAGACGGMYTANTMSSAIEAMGLSLPMTSTMGGGGRGEGGLDRGGGPGPRRRHREGPPAPADPHPGGARERDRGHDGGGRLDERRPPPPGHRPRGRGRPLDRRLRADPEAGAGLLRPQAPPVGTWPRICGPRGASPS